MDRVLVVVTGLPGSGKSSLAERLSESLGMPLLAKDRVKETLATSLHSAESITTEDSRRLSAAAFDLVWSLAERFPAAVLEASWKPSTGQDRLRSSRAIVVEVRCECPPEIARDRYKERSRVRHWAHEDQGRVDDHDLWTTDLPDLSADIVRVDTTTPADIDWVHGQVEAFTTDT